MCMSLQLMVLNLKFMVSLKLINIQLINIQLQHEFSTVFINLRSSEISKLF